MPIVHIVLFKFKETATAAEIDNVKTRLLALPGLLPHLITKATFGKSFTDRHHGFEYAFTVDMPSREALAEYSPHEIHMDVVTNVIRPLVADIMAIDYDV
ncbi:stress responsive alpha-beta barrel domain-containing protein [Blastocladiella britannica]|nr:stress responsive alpha-beta barrel domain-containing protein [Blastocladiella britannica]